jgi:hypothetical protein
MRGRALAGLAVVAIVVGAGGVMLAQTRDTPSTDVQIEIKRQRTIVAPRPDPAPAATEADAEADRLQEQRRVDQLLRKTMEPPPPPLDESVVEGSRSKRWHELPKR